MPTQKITSVQIAACENAHRIVTVSSDLIASYYPIIKVVDVSLFSECDFAFLDGHREHEFI